MHRRGKLCLQKGLHLPDVSSFAVQELLRQNPERMILGFHLVEIPQSMDHAFGISLDQNICHPGIGISSVQLHPGEAIHQETSPRIQFRELPSSLQSNGVDFRFHGIVFP